MELPEYEVWLDRRLKQDRRYHLALATLTALIGGGIACLSVAAGTAAVYSFINQFVEIVYGFWAWKLDLPDERLSIAIIALLFLLLQLVGSRRADGDYIFHLPQVDWQASQNVVAVCAVVWALVMDLIYAGPRLLRFSGEQLRRRRKMRHIDQTLCAAVLQALHRKGHRISFDKLSESIAGFEKDEHHQQLLLIRGILDLHSDPPGLALSTELKGELASGQGDAYRTLELSPGASREEVKEAYQRLIKDPPIAKDSGLSPEDVKRRAHRRKQINQAYGQILDELG